MAHSGWALSMFFIDRRMVDQLILKIYKGNAPNGAFPFIYAKRNDPSVPIQKNIY
jgi:hypothetical protein